MNKLEWVVPVVVMIVWLINTLIKGREEEPAAGAARGRRPVERNPSSDIDRFLQEIDRLRKQNEPERREPAAALPPVAGPVVTAVPVKRPRPQARPVLPPPPPKVRVPPRRPEPAPIESPVAVVDVPVSLAPPAAGSLRQAGPRSWVALAAIDLLRSPESAATAFVLREILDAPRSRRR